MRFLGWIGIIVVASIVIILLGGGRLLAAVIAIALLAFWLAPWAFLRKVTTIRPRAGRQLQRLMKGAKTRLMRFLEWLKTAMIASMKGGAKMRRWIRVSAWVSVVIVLLIVGIALLVHGIAERSLPTLIPGGIILAWLVFWIPRCFRKVGSLESPAQAVRVRMGNPEEVLRPGLHIVWWPVDDLVIYPTKQYLLNVSLTEVHSRREIEQGQETALMEVGVVCYFAWPEGDNLIESFKRAPTPTGDLGEDLEVYTDFFAPTVGDGVRNIMATHTHEECRQEKAGIEREIKAYLIGEPGNPFKAARIPEEQLDVAITRIKFTQEMEKAFSAPEVGRRRGEAEAAEESRALRGVMGAFKAEGVGRLLAGIFTFFLRREGKTTRKRRESKGAEEEL